MSTGKSCLDMGVSCANQEIVSSCVCRTELWAHKASSHQVLDYPLREREKRLK